MELADISDPERLTRALHRQIGPLDRAVPVEEIARGLGIEAIRKAEVDGFEGMLLTDARRSRGRILVNLRRGEAAARFSIAHELGHFLMEDHELGLGGAFTCNRDDMRQVRSMRKHKRQETEANEFAIGLLAPAYAIAEPLGADPDIAIAEALRSRLDLSLEATTRCLVERHDEPLAAVWAKDGRIRYVVRGPRFPWITASMGQRLPPLSRSADQVGSIHLGRTIMREVAPRAWTDADIPELFEQVRLGRDGHTLTLLWASLPDAADED